MQPSFLSFNIDLTRFWLVFDALISWTVFDVCSYFVSSQFEGRFNSTIWRIRNFWHLATGDIQNIIPAAVKK